MDVYSFKGSVTWSDKSQGHVAGTNFMVYHVPETCRSNKNCPCYMSHKITGYFGIS